MRWVLITPLGMPVEPEVNSTLATVSGPTLACAASTAAVGVVARRSENAVDLRLESGLRVTITSSSGWATASMARSKARPSAANTRPGVSSSNTWRSLP